MRNLFILSILIFFGCNDKSSSVLRIDKKNVFLNSLKNDTHSARILFFVDFSTSKSSIIAKVLKDQNSLDTLFNNLGQELTDTSDHCFVHQNPIGEIYLYKDTAMTDELADLYLILSDSCSGISTSLEENSRKFNLNTKGKRTFIDLKNKFQSPRKH